MEENTPMQHPVCKKSGKFNRKRQKRRIFVSEFTLLRTVTFAWGKYFSILTTKNAGNCSKAATEKLLRKLMKTRMK